MNSKKSFFEPVCEQYFLESQTTFQSMKEFSGIPQISKELQLLGEMMSQGRNLMKLIFLHPFNY